MTGARNVICTEELKARLADRAEEVALHLFGRPSHNTKNELRFGQKGSVVIQVAGRHRGTFHCFETSSGGSLIDAFGYHMGLAVPVRGADFVRAKEVAMRWLGEGESAKTRPRVQPIRPIDVDAEARRRRVEARRIYAEAEPIRDQLGAVYLRGRGIERWPQEVRWHINGYLVISVTSPSDSEGKGEITAIQRIYVGGDGEAARDETGQKLKLSLGPRYGGAVRFPSKLTESVGTDRDVLLLAEGPETALSVWQATGMETWAALGSVANLDLSDIPHSTTIVVCKDDDPWKSRSRKTLNETLKRWRQEGRTVLAVLPFEPSRRDKSDFNDALVENGAEYVADRIRSVLSPDHAIVPLRLPLDRAMWSLQHQTAEALETLFKGDGEALVLKVSLGVGKTQQALIGAIDWITKGRGCVVYAVPTHALSNELLARVETLSSGEIRINVWRGREADDPGTLGEKMCRNLDAVRDVQRVGGDPQELVCKKGEHECPYYRECGYQKQRGHQADLWLVPHSSLFSKRPDSIPQPSLLIIDESFWQSGLRGLGSSPVFIAIDQLQRIAWAGSSASTASVEDELRPLRRKLETACERMIEELIHDCSIQFQKETLLAVGLTEDECRQAAKLEWRRKLDIDLHPGMSETERVKTIRTAEANSDIAKLARLWRELADILKDSGPKTSGRLSIETARDKSAGTSYTAIRLTWREDIREGWKAPTLHIDATLDLDLVRPFLPEAELYAEIQADAPHQRVSQYLGKKFGHSAFKSGDWKLAEQVRTFAVCQAILKGGDWLLVSPKGVEDTIRSRSDALNFLDLAHHNGVKGKDEWRNVRGMVVAGRTQPSPADLERIAGALTGVNVRPIEEYYPTATMLLRDKLGNRTTVEADRHPDPIAEKIRQAICENELQQIIGRARGVRREAEAPVEIIVLGEVPVGPVDELRVWKSPIHDQRLIADHGVYLENSHDAAIILGVSENTIRKARQRSGTFSYKEYLLGNVPHLLELQYRKEGRGNRLAKALFDTRTIPEPKEWLRGQLGAVEIFEVQNPLEIVDLVLEQISYVTASSVNTMANQAFTAVEIPASAG